MNNPFFRTKFGVIISCALVSLIILLGAGRAWALPAIQFDVFFDPPSGSPFEGGQLQGSLHVRDSFFDVFNQFDSQLQHDSFFDVFKSPGPLQDSFFDIFYPPDPGAPLPISSFFSFKGNIIGNGLGDPVYAFLPGTTQEQAIQPTDTEMIPICMPIDPCRIDVTDIAAPLYAFSNATQVGYIRARVTSVPEPSTLLLFGSGLIGVVMLGRRRLFR